MFEVGRQFKDTRDNFAYEIVSSDKKQVVAVNVNGFRYVTKFEVIEGGPREQKREWTPRHLATGFRQGRYEWIDNPT